MQSLSVRRAWIEMDWASVITAMTSVALRKESVDRNSLRYFRSRSRYWVALRKESVDRNLWWGVRKAVGSLVALRKESVDRNCYLDNIEITQAVALRKESVDRNTYFVLNA